MKNIIRINFCLLHFLLSFNLHAEGFAAGTLIITQYGLLPIECVSIKEHVINECFITHVTSIAADKYIKIYFNDCCIVAAPDQKLYEKHKGWINACDLLPFDKLLCFNGTTINIDAIENVVGQQIFYAFSVEPNHFFFITHHGIVAHNFEAISSSAAVVSVSLLCPPAGVGLAIVEAIAAGVMCASAYSVYKKHQKKKKLKKEKKEDKESICVSGSSGGGGKKPEDNENDLKKHPHGIYEDETYHKENFSVKKGPRPKNGQRALDNSFEIEGNDRQRISLDENEIVVLYFTSYHRYHGHVRTWDMLEQS